MQDENKYENWKSLLAFFLFMVGYGYSIFSSDDNNIIFTTGLFALLAMFAMMLRSKKLMLLINKYLEGKYGNAR